MKRRQQKTIPLEPLRSNATPGNPALRENLRSTLDRLERALTVAGDPLPYLARLGDPARLDFLFRLELAAIQRAGPGAEISPHRLLGVAQLATAAGALPLATLSALRRTLRRLEKRLHDAGAWDSARPLWWSPLPDRSPDEALWHQTGILEQTLPAHEKLAEAFADADDSPRWLSLPALLPASFIGDLHGQLEAAFDQGALELERAGVGADQRLTARRGDSVIYLSGLEGELLETAPAAAALIQWCLANLGDRLAKAITGKQALPPRSAMLARYPAPSGGYHRHLDNPGGEHDNGRTLTFVLYLNPPDQACAGGEIAVWPPAATTGAPPAAVLPAAGGSAVFFDTRTVAHQVRPLAAGPARWAMILWLNDSARSPPASPPVPDPTLTELLLPVADPPPAAGNILFHELGDAAGDSPPGRISVRSGSPAKPRVGIVCTVYRGGTGLDAWCDHHLALGVDHLVLVFDHLEEAAEAADAERLAARLSPRRLSVLSGSRLAAERWGDLSTGARGELERFADSGSACWAVAARQTLNADAALEAARGDQFGGAPLDWLLHLDADELFYLEGSGRGGETLREHFAAAAASGIRLLRYANHELLDRRAPGYEQEVKAGAHRFKRNPHLAAARLGTAGWSMLVSHLALAQTDPRPYFTGYFNGKAAVAVAHGAAAAGVHGWQLRTESAATSCFLAGPCVLHFHFANAPAFRRKYLAAEAAGDPPDPPLFEPSPVEAAAFESIRALRRDGADEEALARGLDRLHAAMTTFTDHDVELLEAAGLIFEPKLRFPFPPQA